MGGGGPKCRYHIEEESGSRLQDVVANEVES
jgi:hypothetical protein